MQTRVRTINHKPICVWQDEWCDRVFVSENEDHTPENMDVLVIEQRQLEMIGTAIENFLSTEEKQTVETTLSGRQRIIKINRVSISDGCHRLVLDNDDKRWISNCFRDFSHQLKAAIPFA